MDHALSFKAVQKVNRQKYTNIKTGDCPSIKHHRRMVVLNRMNEMGKIQDLKREVPFDLSINSTHICKYIADFTYIKDGEFIVEDVKGRISAEYALKRKMMLAIYGIKILET